MVVQRGVDDGSGRPGKLVKQFQATPGTNAVAVFTPAVVEHIRLGRDRAYAGTQALAKCEMLQVKTDINRQACAIGPDVIGPTRYRAVVKTAADRYAGQWCHGLAAIGDAQASASPARTKSHSALSFQTCIWVISPRLTT